MKSYIIGLTGGSASGKTRFFRSLKDYFNTDQVCFISQDEYYKKKEFQPLDVNGICNFDLPESIDVEAFVKDLKALKEGKCIERKEYTFNNPTKTPQILTYSPAPVIVVEGIFVLYYPEVAEQLDLKIFLDAKEHIRLKRRILRDKEERGYDLHDVLYSYETHVAPTYEKYIEPCRELADIIIPNNHSFDKALDILKVFIESKFD